MPCPTLYLELIRKATLQIMHGSVAQGESSGLSTFDAHNAIYIVHMDTAEIAFGNLVDHEYYCLSKQKDLNAVLFTSQTDSGILINYYNKNNSGIKFLEGWNDALYERIEIPVGSNWNLNSGQTFYTGEDMWKPLSINHKNDACSKVERLVEELYEQVRGKIGYSKSVPEEYSHVTWSLRSGIEAINNRLPRNQQVQSLLGSTKPHLSHKFVGTTKCWGIRAKSRRQLFWRSGRRRALSPPIPTLPRQGGGEYGFCTLPNRTDLPRSHA